MSGPDRAPQPVATHPPALLQVRHLFSVRPGLDEPVKKNRIREAILIEKSKWDKEADSAVQTRPTDGRPSRLRDARDTAHEALDALAERLKIDLTPDSEPEPGQCQPWCVWGDPDHLRYTPCRMDRGD